MRPTGRLHVAAVGVPKTAAGNAWRAAPFDSDKQLAEKTELGDTGYHYLRYGRKLWATGREPPPLVEVWAL